VGTKVYEFPDGKRFELDIENLEHRAWMEERAKTVSSSQVQAPPVAEAPGLTPGRLIAGLGDVVKNTGRMAVKGATAIPGLLMDPLFAIQNKVSDLVQGPGQGERQLTTGSRVENLLENAGMPPPQSATGRVVENAGTALAGSAALPGGNSLIQALSTMMGAGSAGTARELGGGPVMQTAAGLAGGMVPAGAAMAVEPLRRIGQGLIAPYSQTGRDTTKSALLQELVGDKQSAVIEALGNRRPKVSGMEYNASLAAQPAGSTELAALQKALDQRFNPSGARDAALANTEARRAAIGKISGTPEDLQFAKDMRSSTAAITYPEAFKAKIKGDPSLAVLFQNPFVRQAYANAQDTIRSKGLNAKDDLTALLQQVKVGLDDLIAGTAKTTIGTGEKREALLAQKDLVNWLEMRNPKFATAKETFAQQSRPINRMEVGKVLAEKLGAPLDDAERAGVFAQATRDAPRTIKTATGGERFSELSQVLLPRETKAVQNVQSELARLLSAKEQAKAGESRAREVVSGAFEPIEPPGLLRAWATISRAILSRVQHGTSKKTLAELTQDLQDPVKTRELLQKMEPQEKESLVAVWKQMAARGATGATAGTALTVKE
jgi:hypothetical protein